MFEAVEVTDGIAVLLGIASDVVVPLRVFVDALAVPEAIPSAVLVIRFTKVIWPVAGSMVTAYQVLPA